MYENEQREKHSKAPKGKGLQRETAYQPYFCCAYDGLDEYYKQPIEINQFSNFCRQYVGKNLNDDF